MDNTTGLLIAIDDKVQGSLAKTARIVVKAAKDGAPVDKGDLRRSIHAELTDGELTIGSTVAYGDIQEVAQPHLRPALHGKKLAIERAFSE